MPFGTSFYRAIITDAINATMEAKASFFVTFSRLMRLIRSEISITPPVMIGY